MSEGNGLTSRWRFRLKVVLVINIAFVLIVGSVLISSRSTDSVLMKNSLYAENPFSDIESVEMFGSTVIVRRYPPSWSRAEYAVFDLSSGEKTTVRLTQREISSFRISYPFIPRSLFLEGHREHVDSLLGTDELGGVSYVASPTLSKALLQANNKYPEGLTLRERVEIPSVGKLYLYDRNTSELTLIESGLTTRWKSLGGFSASERTAIYSYDNQTKLFDLETLQLSVVVYPGMPVQISNGICFLIFDEKTHTYVSINESGKKLYELTSDKIRKPYDGYALNEHLFIVKGSVLSQIKRNIQVKVYLLDLATGYVKEIGNSPPSGRVVKVNYKK